MAPVISLVRPFFKTRLLIAGLSLAGFWICLARVEWSQGRTGGAPPAVRGQGDGPDRINVTGEPGAGPAAAENVPGPAVDLPAPMVMIDAGHGGADGGMVRNGLIEKDWTLKVGSALAGELKKRGHLVGLTRETDVTVPLEQRPVLVNAAPRIALLSIHFNAGTPDASGVETWYSWPKKPEVMARLHDEEGVPVTGVRPDDGQRLALAVQQSVTRHTGARDRGIKNREDLALTSRTVCPAVLIECGFLSNGPESRKIQDAAYREKLVQGIADGYEEWLKGRVEGQGESHPPVPVAVGLPPAAPPAGVDAEH